MDYIIDNWTDPHILTLIYQQPEFRNIAESIYKLKDKMNNKNGFVCDNYILSFTKKFNDKIFEKYGFDYFMIGIYNLIAFDCTPAHCMIDGQILKKTWFNAKNRKAFQICLDKKKEEKKKEVLNQKIEVENVLIPRCYINKKYKKLIVKNHILFSDDIWLQIKSFVGLFEIEIEPSNIIVNNNTFIL
jgi:hypothetical protein